MLFYLGEKMCSDNNDQYIKEFFEEEYGRTLTNQEFLNIKQNLVGFFRLLIDMERNIKNGE
jgi:hypothetical protein